MIGNGLKLEEAGGPFWFYQMLPYFSQAWHKPLVDLVWSTKRYHSPDLGLTYRVPPLPTLTTAATRLTSNQIHHMELDSRAGGATVIRVDNVENRRNHQKWWHGGWSASKRKFFFIRPVGLRFYSYGGKTGRAMIKYPHIEKNAQPRKRVVYPGQ